MITQLFDGCGLAYFWTNRLHDYIMYIIDDGDTLRMRFLPT